MAGYSPRSLVEKLGIKPGTAVVVLGGPPEFPATLGPLPEGAGIRTRLSRGAAFIHQFARRKDDLAEAFPRLAQALADDGMLWISWPKKTSKIATDLTEDVVRSLGLPLGLVDVKVCAIDETWSGIKFVRRKELRG
jgi:hypothetical protein